jgi:hypothetical protein
MEAMPRNSWEEIFKSQGMKNLIPRIQLLGGFNQGWINFEWGKLARNRDALHWRQF